MKSDSMLNVTKSEFQKIKKMDQFYPLGKPCDAASPLLAGVRSTLVRLHPGRLGSAASSAFATSRIPFIILKSVFYSCIITVYKRRTQSWPRLL
jgi:hypothetical protein